MAREKGKQSHSFNVETINYFKYFLFFNGKGNGVDKYSYNIFYCYTYFRYTDFV